MMMMKCAPMQMVTVAALMIGLGAGCSTIRKDPPQDVYTQLDIKESEIRRLNAALESQNRELETRTVAMVEKAEVRTATATPSAPDTNSLLPPNAKPGECYARVYIPPTYKQVEERVLVQEASENVEMIPAEYEWVEEEVVVKEASTRIEVVPAKYELREERVLVTPASTRVEQVPAEYVWTEEKVLVKPAHTEWKKGRGPIQQVDNATGEIMCLVEVPAEYKTVKKKVLQTPASTRTVDVPAEYTTVKKNVLVVPETTRKITIPAETKRVRVKKLVKPEQKKVTPVEAQYQTVKKQAVDQRGGIGWRRVLCETNLSGEIVKRVQQSLLDAGHNPGPIDGIIGTQTQSAIQTFQGANNLAVGGLTFETLKKLGIDIAAASN